MPDEATKAKAMALFDQIVSALYWPRASESCERTKIAIENLIAFLEKRDC